MTYMEVRRLVVWQESNVLRAFAAIGRSTVPWRHPDYWAEYLLLRHTVKAAA